MFAQSSKKARAGPQTRTAPDEHAMPAYNEEGKIGRVVEKVAAVVADLPCHVEIVVMDGCSTDGTQAEAEPTADSACPPPRASTDHA